MFACGLYPTHKAYMDNVRRDVEHNIVRLRNHACMALWCGNNEMEWFLAGGWDAEKNAQRRRQYCKIFYDLIPSAVNRLDPDTAYRPSSPASDQPFEDPNSETRGDGHYWDVWHGRLPFAAYRTKHHRFMSEFGSNHCPRMRPARPSRVTGT